jgi:EmrB/QacA subfamily drug resistance transporter
MGRKTSVVGRIRGARDRIAVVTATDDTKASDAPDASAVPTAYQFTHRQIQTVLIGLMSGSFLAALDQTIVATALPRIVGDFGGVDQLAWIASIYLLTSTAAMPLVGKLSDLYGRRLLFQASIIVFMVGSLMAGVSQTMGQLIAARAVQGFGAGGLIVLNFSVLADIVAPRERGKYQGYVASVWAVASVFGPVLGGIFVDNLTWRWIFWINLPVGVVALFVTSAVLKLPPRDRPRVAIDYLGAALLVAVIVSLLLVTEWGGHEYDWVSPQIVGLVVAGVMCAVLFVWCELRAADPIIPPRLFRIPTFRISSSAITVFGMVMFGSVLFVPVYFQIVRGDTATNAGLLLFPQMIGILTATISAGRLTTRTGRYKVFPLVGLVLIAGSFIVLSRIQPDTPVPVAIACMILVGAGIGMTTPALLLSVQNTVPTADVGAATSSMTTVRSMGASVGAAVFGAVLTARLNSELAQNLSRAARRLDPELLRGSPDQIARLPERVQAGVIESFADALSTVFLAAVPMALLALAIVIFLPELPLRTRAEMIEPTVPMA